MKTVLICPCVPSTVPHLGEHAPLAAGAILGKSLAAYWLEHVAARGARHVLLVAVDRPDQVAAAVGDGSRWGLRIEIVPETRELAASDARAKFREAHDKEWLESPDDAILMDRLPGLEQHPLFETYSGWFAAIQAFLPRAATADRIGLREARPGIWMSLSARVAPTAQLHPPCWIGDHARVGPGAVIGPDSVLEDGVVVESGARIVRSTIGPGTFVGKFTLVENSLAMGDALANWRNGSCLRVPDAFILSSLKKAPAPKSGVGRILRSLSTAAASFSLKSRILKTGGRVQSSSKLNAL